MESILRQCVGIIKSPAVAAVSIKQSVIVGHPVDGMKIGICDITDVESHHVSLVGMPAMVYKGMALH